MEKYLTLRNKNYTSSIVSLESISENIKALAKEGNGEGSYYFAINMDGQTRVFLVNCKHYESGQVAFEFFRDYEKYGTAQDMHVTENYLICSFSSRGLDHVLTDPEVNTTVETREGVIEAMAVYVEIFLDAMQVINKMPY